jgi:uncharacterized protein
MTLTMHQAAAPLFTQHLTNLSGILTKAAAHAEAKKIDPSVFLNARLAPDMFPLTRQVQVVSDNAKGGMSRLAGVEIPSWPDNEASFPELQARLAKTIEYVKSFKPEQLDGSEDKKILVKLGPNEIPFTGRSLLFGFQIPNFLFHCAMAYAILRHHGVEIGKLDFIGGLPS